MWLSLNPRIIKKQLLIVIYVSSLNYSLDIISPDKGILIVYRYNKNMIVNE
jgi:hypothetical protein